MGRMNEVLAGREGNYLIPFFWQNGGGEVPIREEMKAIRQSGIRAVCVESRVHPDFLGPDWWRDMDVIMEEARRLDMRVWVLDDAHFPTGYANGAVRTHPEARKRYLDCVRTDAAGPLRGSSFMVRLEPGEQLIAVTAGRTCGEGSRLSELIDLTDRVRGGLLYWDVPEGVWTVSIIKVTDRSTGRKEYINLIDRRAVRLLLETVYEPHFRRYGDCFGDTFAGFFSDEPEIGNVLSEYGHDARIGRPDAPLPWCEELKERLRQEFGPDQAVCLTALWMQIDGISPRARRCFMEAVADLYSKNFSCQAGDWCRDHGVEYIGHVIEDNGCHSRLGLGTGHFFKALWGQDMSGIDVVLQQIRPGLCGGGFYSIGGKGQYDGRFFHYGLAKMGVSLAYLDEKKRGRTMCEIFGAYGWTEGLKLMKWLADHMLVRGVNYFVPHAFSMKEFPDPDCPPHFYAHGQNPQYPYFRYLCAYMNRMCHLLQGGRPVFGAAVFYHACAEWMGGCDGFETPGSRLMQRQIDYLVLPETELLAAEVSGGKLRTRAGDCGLLVFPRCEYLPGEVLDWCDCALEQGLRIVVEKQAPRRAESGLPYRNPKLEIAEDLADLLEKENWGELKMDRRLPDLRYSHYRRGREEFFFFFNESVTETAKTRVRLPGPADGELYRYDAFENRLYWMPLENGTLALRLVPGEAAVFYRTGTRETPDAETLYCGSTQERLSEADRSDAGEHLPAAEKWRDWENAEAAVCAGTWKLQRTGYDGREYPEIRTERLFDVTGPEGDPFFSGTMTYELVFGGRELLGASAFEEAKGQASDGYLLDCGEVCETMSVRLNGKPLGVRIAAPYTVRIGAGDLLTGENHLCIEVRNTLVHALQDPMSASMPVEPSGLLGPVRIIGGTRNVL